MKTRRLLIFTVVGVIAAAALACGGSFSTASIDKAVLTTDKEGTQETTTFSPDQTFYCIVTLANAPEDTKIKAVWTAVDVEGEDANTKIDEAETTAGNENIFTFNLTNNGLWPSGKYKVDLYLNDTLDRTLDFEVQ
jgi:hypothetical protein